MPRRAAVAGSEASPQMLGMLTAKGLKFCSAETRPMAARITSSKSPSCATMSSASESWKAHTCQRLLCLAAAAAAAAAAAGGGSSSDLPFPPPPPAAAPLPASTRPGLFSSSGFLLTLAHGLAAPSRELGTWPERVPAAPGAPRLVRAWTAATGYLLLAETGLGNGQKGSDENSLGHVDGLVGSKTTKGENDWKK